MLSKVIMLGRGMYSSEDLPILYVSLILYDIEQGSICTLYLLPMK